MKVNLQKLSEFEAMYVDKPVTLSALSNMVEQIVWDHGSDEMGLPVSDAKGVAIATLQELGIIN